MAGDLISREGLFKSWDGLADEIKDPDLLIDEMIRRAQEAPAVDVEPVIRCRNCKHWEGGADESIYADWCSYLERTTSYEFYCAKGERDGGGE